MQAGLAPSSNLNLMLYTEHFIKEYVTEIRLLWNILTGTVGFDLPSALPHSASSVFLRVVADPAVTQYLTVTGAQLTYPICYVFAFFHPCALRDIIFDSHLK